MKPSCIAEQIHQSRTDRIIKSDEYGNRLPDKIDLGTPQGITLKIVDPEKYGRFYFELKGIEFPRIEPKFEFEPSFIDEDDLPF